jgi:p-hydroxybenzoate 3-monooxygenase
MVGRTQVAIVGAGPAGLLLGRLLRLAGVDTVILERCSRAYVESRIRAGMLEHATVEVLEQAGVADRLHRLGAYHEGFELRFDGTRTRVPVTELTGRVTVIYPQQEVVKDLLAARDATGDQTVFEVSDVELRDVASDRPAVRYRAGGAEHELRCDLVAGCDGFHGVCRPSIPAGALRTFGRDYPFAWLGVLADVPPSTEELIYAHHPDGFALHSMRGPTRSRFYLQVPPDEKLDRWPDERIWAALRTRLATDDDWELAEGPILQRSITPMRSFVCEPMQHGNLFLAGDAAHIVPPSAAKGLNLAVSDVTVLADAMVERFEHGDRSMLDAYSELALPRVWLAQEFSRSMTSLLHHEPGDDLDARLQRTRLRTLVACRSTMTAFCQVYAGMPFEGRIRHRAPVGAA